MGSELSSIVVEAVAEREGVDATDLDPPLRDVLDPDALDRLFAADEGDGRREGVVAFPYCGYTVIVNSEGTISVEPDDGHRGGCQLADDRCP